MKRSAAAFGILAILALASAPAAVAQDAIPLGEPLQAEDVQPVPTEERVTLRVGDVFEIVADAGLDGVTTSWILTQERTFIEAGREHLFRYRFVQDKEYTLRGEVTLPGTGERRQRTFIIDVRPVAEIPNMPVYPAGTGASLAGTVPAPDANGRVIFTPEQQLLQLAPIRSDLSPLALDLDASRDTDGDGNPANDVDDTDTYFHSFGRSLWIWFARPIDQTDLIITAIPEGGSPLVQRISVLSEETAGQQGVLTSQVSIDVETIDDATFGFTPVLGRDVPEGASLLYEWEFGDGDRSLENAPTHSYATSGSYDVKLQVRDIGTGNIVGTSTTSVSATAVDPVPEEPDPIVEEPDPEPVEEPSNDEGLPWGRIILVAALFAGSLVAGVAVVWLLSFLRRSRKLEETLETMEKAVSPAKEEAPPPLAIKSKPQSPPPSAQQKVIDAEINAASSPKAPPPAVTEAAAPDWLKKGLVSESAPTPAPAAVPAAPKAPAPAKPAPAPAAVTPAAPKPAQAAPVPTPKPQAPTPAAAKAPTAPAAAKVQAPKPAPAAPQVPAAPKPQQTPVAEPKPAPAPTSQPPAPKVQQAAPSLPQATAAATPPTAVPAQTATNQNPAPGPTPPTVPPPQPKNDNDKLPRWLQPAPPAPVASAPSPAPVTPAETAPATAPVAAAQPKPVAPATPTAPTQVTPPPAVPAQPKPSQTPSQPIPPQEPKDDDRPIAIIRAESIDPGPAK